MDPEERARLLRLADSIDRVAGHAAPPPRSQLELWSKFARKLACGVT